MKYFFCKALSRAVLILIGLGLLIFILLALGLFANFVINIAPEGLKYFYAETLPNIENASTKEIGFFIFLGFLLVPFALLCNIVFIFLSKAIEKIATNLFPRLFKEYHSVIKMLEEMVDRIIIFF